MAVLPTGPAAPAGWQQESFIVASENS